MGGGGGSRMGVRELKEDIGKGQEGRGMDGEDMEGRGRAVH